MTAGLDGVGTFGESGAVIDASGRILTSGITHTAGASDYDFSVVRLNGDKTVDRTFGTGGTARIVCGVGDGPEGWRTLTLEHGPGRCECPHRDISLGESN